MSKVKSKLEFAKRGKRRFNYHGMYYVSTCGRYELYKGDRLFGVDMDPARWVSFSITNGVRRVIGRHLGRKPAERACEKFDKTR